MEVESPAPAFGTQPTITASECKYTLTAGTAILAMKRDGTLVTWELNRDLDKDRVSRMYDTQVALLIKGSKCNLFMPTPIYACRPTDSKPTGAPLVLIDGQHRLAVLEQLSRQAGMGTDGIEIMLCVIDCPKQSIDDVFVRINSGTPVPSAYYDRKVKALLAEYTAYLQKEYPLTISKALHPHRPNFNLTAVRDEMSSSVAFRDAVIDGRVTLKMLTSATVEENKIEAGISHRKAPDSVLARAEKTGFWLGLREGWPTVVALKAATQSKESVFDKK